MRKRITELLYPQPSAPVDPGWLDLERLVTVEATSEDPRFPIESVFNLENGSGWRALNLGKQRIRLLFDQPVSLHRIQLCFQETAFERTQEFTLRWWSAKDASVTELVRQQWNFSPAGATTEIENYTVDLEAVSVLELAIQPDISSRDAVATLVSWRLS